MLKVYLIRHAEAHVGMVDFDRLLTPHGEEAALSLGEHLRKILVIQPDQVISSPAVRAFTTAQLITQQLDYPSEKVQTDPALYNASLETLVSVLEHMDDSYKSILLVAHNPGMTQLANYLVDVPVDHLPTCGLCMIELPADNWQSIKAHSGKLQQ
jgi:phosphohistidine phosphatase